MLAKDGVVVHAEHCDVPRNGDVSRLAQADDLVGGRVIGGYNGGGFGEVSEPAGESFEVGTGIGRIRGSAVVEETACFNAAALEFGDDCVAAVSRPAVVELALDIACGAEVRA